MKYKNKTFMINLEILNMSSNQNVLNPNKIY